MEPLTVDGGKGTVELRSDGVIHLIWEPKVRIEIEDAQAAMAAVNEIAG
ncbi:STAS/SEC14 domain-containing protein, partial [Arthrobacter sp. S1_S22]|nr:STAS/SEC14 domain-containing protein [Arthrobacter sp. S1_S22]